ncbi:MAG: DNA repair protein RecO [Prevotella sp.]|nr:DNA repair protein RecO [Prevotella sp.]
MLTKTKAIVLHSFKYNDNRLIVDLFTLDRGRMSVAVTVSSSPKAKFRKNLFSPFTLLYIETDYRQGARLQKLRDASIAYPMASIPFDHKKASIVLFVSEFLYHALKGEQESRSLFEFIADSIQWLDIADDDFVNFHIVFLLRLTLFLGFMPNLDDYEDGDLFDLRSSSFVKTIPPHHDFLDIQESALVRTMMRMNFRTMHLFRLSRPQRNRLLDIIIKYYRFHLPDFPEMKSLEVLHALYSSPKP